MHALIILFRWERFTVSLNARLSATMGKEAPQNCRETGYPGVRKLRLATTPRRSDLPQ